MKPDVPLDYAIFQLSPKRTRYELIVFSNGKTEKLAAGLVKPFVTHLKVAEEQVALSVQSIKLEVEGQKNAETWFTKGTLERFVRFVSTPEVLELVNTFDAEMSQLEAAQRIYLQELEDRKSSLSGGGGTMVTMTADATKNELSRAIDVRLVAVRQDLTTAYACAVAAGFNTNTVSELRMFANCFDAHRLNEACNKFISLCERRSELLNPWKVDMDDQAVRASYGSDMSIDEDLTTLEPNVTPGFNGLKSQHHHVHYNKHPSAQEPDYTRQKHPEQPKHFMQQQPKVTHFLQLSGELSIEKDDTQGEPDEKVKKEENLEQSEYHQTSHRTRRLSVQDRINLFESKQKENSGSAGKPMVGKSAELRRLSSDVPSNPGVVEKAVLRRWSGASDMSIDLSSEKKDIESPLSTPLSASVSKSILEDRKGLNDTATSAKPEFKTAQGAIIDSDSKLLVNSQTQLGATSGREEVAVTTGATKSGIQLSVSSGQSEDTSEPNKSSFTFGTVESDGWSNETRGKTLSRSFSKETEDNSSKDCTTSLTRFRSLLISRGKQFGSMDQGKVKGSFGCDKLCRSKEKVPSEAEIAGPKGLAALQTQYEAVASWGGEGAYAGESCQSLQADPKQAEDAGLKSEFVYPSCSKASLRTPVDSGRLEGNSESKIRETFAAHYTGVEVDSLSSQSRWRSLGETEEVGKKGSESSEKQSNNSESKVEESGLQRMNFQKQVSIPEKNKNLQFRGENKPVSDNSKALLSCKMVSENCAGSGSVAVVHAAQFQRVRQLKGTQELNDGLKMKANGLEKLFAEHKLRVPRDQSNSKWRGKPAHMGIDQEASLSYCKEMAELTPTQVQDKNSESEPSEYSSNGKKLNSSSLMKMVDGGDHGVSLMQSFSELGLSDDSRGKLYDKYMQKRDAKLREEWGSKRAEKEAKMKTMQESFEKNKAEMIAKFLGSAKSQDSVISARRRAERLRSFNSWSTVKREQPGDFVQSEDDEDLSFGGGICRRTQVKSLLPDKSFSSTPCTSTASAPRSTVKPSNSGPGWRRLQSENPLAHSVPNFSDLRKENTKPYSVASKTTKRPQLRNYVHSKTTVEEISFAKEEKSRRSQNLRKSSANCSEFKSMTTLNSEDALTSLKFDEEQHSDSKNLEGKPFLGKNNVTGPGVLAGTAKLRVSLASRAIPNAVSDELAFVAEDAVDVVKDEEESATMRFLTNNSHANVDNGKSRLRQQAGLLNSGSENGDSLGSFSQADPSVVAELPTTTPSSLQPLQSMQDSPGESPVSWNAGVHHSFSYPHETSDIDVSVDSLTGSPAWNSLSLNQIDSDVARTRKKWGSTQKPNFVTNSSQNQSRKDMTKGLKRLLKFGRKNRGTENLVDWVSATTSDGDDDTEDGRENVNRSSEDFWKTRMGFSQGPPSNDSFNESKLFGEQVQSPRSAIPAPPANSKLREDHLLGSPVKGTRSFFSLSSFRSKGSDSKPR